MTTTTKQPITIFADHVYAGQGFLSGGSIECDAILGGSQDACEPIYDAIEEAIADEDDSVEVDGVEYTWTIGE